MKTHIVVLVLALVTVLFAAGCAPTPTPPSHSPGTDSDVAGFWKGLWHGLIVLFTFVISLFNDNVGIYQAHNSGNLYNLGFVLGLMIFFSGCGGGACKKAR